MPRATCKRQLARAIWSAGRGWMWRLPPAADGGILDTHEILRPPRGVAATQWRLGAMAKRSAAMRCVRRDMPAPSAWAWHPTGRKKSKNLLGNGTSISIRGRPKGVSRRQHFLVTAGEAQKLRPAGLTGFARLWEAGLISRAVLRRHELRRAASTYNAIVR